MAKATGSPSMETQLLPVGKTRYNSSIRDLIILHDIQQAVHSIPAEVHGVPPSVLAVLLTTEFQIVSFQSPSPCLQWSHHL